jgi:hypothetical protein
MAPGYQRGGYNPGGGALPTRNLRTEVPQSTPQPNYAAAAPAAAPGYGGGYGYGAAAPQQPQSQLTQEEQAILIEAQRAQSQAGVTDPNLAHILPPTILTPPTAEESQPSSTGPASAPNPGSSIPSALQPKYSSGFPR